MVDIDDSTGTERARCEENDASLADNCGSIEHFAVSKSSHVVFGLNSFKFCIDT